jgi:hypothetical protein
VAGNFAGQILLGWLKLNSHRTKTEE